MENRDETSIYFHGFDPIDSPWPYHVAAGGRTFVSDKDGIVNRRYHQHTFILTLSGEGEIRVGDREFHAKQDNVVWLDTSRKYEHGAAPDCQWSYVWIAMSGHSLDKLYELIGLSAQPVFEDMDHLLQGFEKIVQCLADRFPTADALMNAQVSAIVAELFAQRGDGLDRQRANPVSKIMRQLRKDLSHDWDITSMATVTGLSQSQLFRRFQTATGTSPMSWLRRERMVLAEHLLTVSSETVSGVAQRCGYTDPFHFSRDFKRHCGYSPRAFRANARF